MSSSGEGSRQIAVIDEILQVMFWLRGEGLASEVSGSDLSRWITLPPEEVRPLFQRMLSAGLIETVRAEGGPRYRLTERGVSEGGRRFAAEFADLTRPGHGECGDPDCECQRTGRIEDCRHLKGRAR
jgi:DNA-binding PadR family transcriptional regulator